MDIYMLVLRLIHVFGGVFWVGSALLFFFFLEPVSKNTAPEGIRFVNYLVKQGKLALWIGISAAATIVSGVLLYWINSNGFKLSWIMTTGGILFSIGSIAGILAFILGLVVIAPTTTRLANLGQEIEKAGKPTGAQKKELYRMQKIIERVGKIDLILLLIALAFMVIAPEFIK